MKKLQFAKIKYQCGLVTLIPVYEVFHVYEPIKCEKCKKVIAKPRIDLNKLRLMYARKLWIQIRQTSKKRQT